MILQEIIVLNSLTVMLKHYGFFMKEGIRVHEGGLKVIYF